MATMSVKTLLEIVPNLPVVTSILLRGAHGIGKSQLARAIARMIASAEKIDKFELIDRRLSQMSEGDMIGLPSTDGEVTRFNPPDWFKRACTQPVFLFLDELNRATPEVMQAAFQIVLDRELNGWKLHPQTRVMSAINSSAQYTVNEMDPALLDRFWTIDLEPTVGDFLIWGKGEGKLSDSLLQFIQANDKWLDTPKDCSAGDVTPSRRSWAAMDNAHRTMGICDTPEDPRFYQVALGYVGAPATIAFVSFAKNIDKQVSGKEIIESYDKVKGKIAGLGQEKLNICSEKVAEYITKKCKTLDDNQGKNLAAFMKDLPGEIAVMLWSKVTHGAGTANIDLAKAVHKHCVEIILEVFGSNGDKIKEALEAAAKKNEEEKNKPAEAKKGKKA